MTETITLTGKAAERYAKQLENQAKARAKADEKYAGQRIVRRDLLDARRDYVDSDEFRAKGFSNAQVSYAVDVVNREEASLGLNADGTKMTAEEHAATYERFGYKVPKSVSDQL